MHIAKVACLKHIFEMMEPPTTDPNHLPPSFALFHPWLIYLRKRWPRSKNPRRLPDCSKKHHLYDLTCER